MRLKTAKILRRYTQTHNSPAETLIVLGIDPGLARTGIGIVSRSILTCSHVHHDVVRTSPGDPLAQRLAKISAAVTDVCDRFNPQCAAIENTFVNQNPASSLALGQARGAALAVLGMADLPVYEVAPSTVKSQITRDGTADKKLVATMVKAILNLSPQTRLPADASDALAIALCHARAHQFLLRRRTRRRR